MSHDAVIQTETFIQLVLAVLYRKEETFLFSFVKNYSENGRLCYVGEPPAASHDRFIDEDGDQWSGYLCLSSVTASWVE